MRKKLALLFVLTGFFPAALANAAAPENPPVKPPADNEKSMQAEVVDPAVYLKDGLHGTDRIEQTYEAVDGGQTLALLEEGTNALYLLLAEQPGEDPNELVYDYANQVVKVKGRVVERGGLRGIILTSAEPVAAAPGNTTSGLPSQAKSAGPEENQ